MIYSLLYTIFILLFGVAVLFRPAYRKKYFSTLKQRLGFGLGGVNPEGAPSIWVHAVSVGETLAVRSLIKELRASYPDHRILVSSTTITGQHTARQHLAADGYFYMPYDWKWCLRRARSAIQPSLLIIVETELWPNLIKTMNEGAVPLVIVNGRLSDRSFARYRRLRMFFRPLLRRFHSICCQSAEDASRYRQLGAVAEDVINTGNIKFTPDQFTGDTVQIEALRRRLAISAERPVFLAASIHKGEHEEIMRAWTDARKRIPELRLVLVPRKPMEFPFFAEYLADNNYQFDTFSSDKDELSADVVLVDSIGQLGSLYHIAAIAFTGGSFVPVGGHNILEASAAATPVLFGPHMHNFRDARAMVLESGAGAEVGDETQLAMQITAVLADPDKRHQWSSAGRRLLETTGDALRKTINVIKESLSSFGARQYVPWYYRLAAGLHRALVRIVDGSPEKTLNKGKTLPRPVISVGGLSFGGAGKTPLVSEIIEILRAGGVRPGILTRGYRGTARDPHVISDGGQLLSDPREAGDEAHMLALEHPEAVVVKDANRYRGGQRALEVGEVDVFVLDDGFQHRRLRRDLNLLAISADSLVSPRIPAHLLREPLDYARLADAYIVQSSTPERTEAAVTLLNSRYPGKPVFLAEFQIESLIAPKSGERVALQTAIEQKYAAVCGIAAPHRFISSLRKAGCNLQESHLFADHYQYTPRDVDRISASLKASGAGGIITTSKDYQRWQPAAENAASPPDVLVAAGGIHLDRPSEFEALLQELVN